VTKRRRLVTNVPDDAASSARVHHRAFRDWRQDPNAGDFQQFFDRLGEPKRAAAP
jgi:hypothetical protein